MAICFNFKLSIFFFMFFFFCTCALAQQDPPRRDCCYHIFAAGSNLGCASALLDHTIERTRLEAADLPIIDNIKRAGPHIREANRACSYINPAWNDWRGRTNWLQERADMLRKKPVPGTRRQVARSIASTYQWGDALRVQLADGRRFTMDTCGEKYFELGFLFGYAQQALKIADEWLHAGRNYWRSPIRAARSKLHRSLQVLDQYDLVRPITGSCVNIVNLRLRETVSYILKANAQYELKTMINAMDNIWWDLEERVQNDCPGVQVPDDRDWDWDSDPIPPPDPNQRNRCSKLEQAFYRAIDRGFTDKAHSILIQGEDCPFYRQVMDDSWQPEPRPNRKDKVSKAEREALITEVTNIYTRKWRPAGQNAGYTRTVRDAKDTLIFYIRRAEDCSYFNKCRKAFACSKRCVSADPLDGNCLNKCVEPLRTP